MANLEFSQHRCPKCSDLVEMKYPARDVYKIWCGGINCALWFTPDGKILSDREAEKLSLTTRLEHVFKNH